MARIRSEKRDITQVLRRYASRLSRRQDDSEDSPEQTEPVPGDDSGGKGKGEGKGKGKGNGKGKGKGQEEQTTTTTEEPTPTPPPLPPPPPPPPETTEQQTPPPPPTTELPPATTEQPPPPPPPTSTEETTTTTTPQTTPTLVAPPRFTPPISRVPLPFTPPIAQQPVVVPTSPPSVNTPPVPQFPPTTLSTLPSPTGREPFTPPIFSSPSNIPTLAAPPNIPPESFVQEPQVRTGLSDGQKAGAVIGSLLGAAILAGLVTLLVRWWQRRRARYHFLEDEQVPDPGWNWPLTRRSSTWSEGDTRILVAPAVVEDNAPRINSPLAPPVPAKVRDHSGWDWDFTSVFSLPRLSVPAYTPQEMREDISARSHRGSIWEQQTTPRGSYLGTVPPPPRIVVDEPPPSPKGSLRDRLHPLLQNPVRHFQPGSRA